MANLIVEIESRGLIRQVLCESIGGFGSTRFPHADKHGASSLLHKLDKGELTLEDQDLPLLKNVLQFALKELGAEEFQTIIGYPFESGVMTLKKLEER
jgi:hypothetical protein